MKLLTKIAFVFCIFSSVAMGAELVNEDLNRFVICRIGKTIRTIRVSSNVEGPGCVTTYTKNGVDRNVGSGRNWASCLNFLDNIKANLEGASWKCRVVDNASVSLQTE